MSVIKNKGGSKQPLKSFFKTTNEMHSDIPMNTGAMTNAVRGMMGTQPLSEPLRKSVHPQVVKGDVAAKYDKSKIVFSSREWTQISENVWTKGWRRISDSEQREISQLDPYIAAIISTRCSQGAACGYRSESKFDKGCRVVDLAPISKDDFDSEEEYKKASDIRSKQQDQIMAWMLRCGTHDQDTLNAIFAGTDMEFKRCTLREFLEAQIRNILTFGRCGTQVFYNDEGLPVLFRPVAIETIFNVVAGENTSIGKSQNTLEQSLDDVAAYNKIKAEEKPAAYAQRDNGQNINFFTEDDLHIWHWQKQAYFNLNGYPLSPIEQAIYMVFVHQQTLSYLRNQFVKGLATKGLLALESTNPAVELSEADLEDFRVQFHNYATRNDNNAVLPVLSGPIKANYIQLSPTPRDMEFLQVEEHVIRALCSAFQISPQEMGYGHLSMPQGGITQANKQEEIVKGEERGLRQLLDIIFDGINEIMYLNFPEAKDNFRLSYVGVGEDTRDAVVNRQMSELQTTATMDSLYADSEKQDVIPAGGKVPLATVFHQNVVRYMKYGDFLEKFFGEKGAAQKPEYNFIIDPQLNQAYQQLLVQPVKEQRQQAEMQSQLMEQQMQAQEQQMQQGGQPGQPAQEGGSPQEGGQPAEGEQQAPPQEQQAQPVEKSEESVPLRQMWLSSQGLAKSMSGYFGGWIQAHYNKDE